MLRRLLAPITVLAVVIGFSVAPVAAQSDRYAFTDLGVLGGLDSHAWALNAGGQVTGHADTSPDSGTRGFHAFLWTPSTPNGTTGSMIAYAALSMPPKLPRSTMVPGSRKESPSGRAFRPRFEVTFAQSAQTPDIARWI